MGFTKSEVYPNLYFILVGVDPFILVLYIDDLCLTGAEDLIARCKAYLAIEFEEDCRSMATPMVTKLKKVVNSDSELVDPRIYR
jgi:hypothetical protein